MKILIMSDSHSGRQYMELAIERQQPDAVIHLGDYYSDAEKIMSQTKDVKWYAVKGNCDLSASAPAKITADIEGVRFFMTHGHEYGVKFTLSPLIDAALAERADVCLFGHTHIPCHVREKGMTVINPGTISHPGGTYAVIIAEKGNIIKADLVNI